MPPEDNPAPCRVLFVDHTAALGGGEIALLHLASHLDRSRFTPIVLLSSPGELHVRLQQAKIETYLLELHPAIVHTRKDSLGKSSLLRLKDMARIFGYSLRLTHFIRKHRIDIVHTNSLKSDVFGGAAARLAGVPVVWHVRDRIENDYLPASVVRVFRWLCCHLPNFVIVNSQATLDTLTLPEGKPAAIVYSGQKYHIVHDGVIAGRNSAVRTTVACDDPVGETFRIGLVGRISPWKGQDIFIQAARKVCVQYPAARFLIIGAPLFGEEAYETELHALVTRNGLERHVEFLGFREDIPELIASLSILVHASTVPEPFGQVVIEGMAAGKPIVATRGGGVKEIIVEGETGLLVEMGSVDEMTAAICTLLANPVRSEKMGRAAQFAVQQNFTIEQTAARVEAVYKTLMANKGSLRKRT